jgi:hypothetical protein
LEQGGALDPGPEIGLVRRGKDVDAGLGDLLDDEDAGHAESLRLLGRKARRWRPLARRLLREQWAEPVKYARSGTGVSFRVQAAAQGTHA